MVRELSLQAFGRCFILCHQLFSRYFKTTISSEGQNRDILEKLSEASIYITFCIADAAGGNRYSHCWWQSLWIGFIQSINICVHLPLCFPFCSARIFSYNTLSITFEINEVVFLNINIFYWVQFFKFFFRKHYICILHSITL